MPEAEPNDDLTLPVELPPEHRDALDDPPEFTDEQLVYLEALLAAGCCHTTGMHDPTHWRENGTVCWQSMHEPYKRALRELNLDVPIRSDFDCGWCRDYYEDDAPSPYAVEYPTYNPERGIIGLPEEDGDE